jgi:hypothetical protein
MGLLPLVGACDTGGGIQLMATIDTPRGILQIWQRALRLRVWNTVGGIVVDLAEPMTGTVTNKRRRA